MEHFPQSLSLIAARGDDKVLQNVTNNRVVLVHRKRGVGLTLLVISRRFEEKTKLAVARRRRRRRRRRRGRQQRQRDDDDDDDADEWENAHYWKSLSPNEKVKSRVHFEALDPFSGILECAHSFQLKMRLLSTSNFELTSPDVSSPNESKRSDRSLINFQTKLSKMTRLGSMLVLIEAIMMTTFFISSTAELYTALADMEELLETESVLIDTLNGYIKAQEQRLATLRKDFIRQRIRKKIFIITLFTSYFKKRAFKVTTEILETFQICIYNIYDIHKQSFEHSELNSKPKIKFGYRDLTICLLKLHNLQIEKRKIILRGIDPERYHSRFRETLVGSQS
ncbi:prolyl 4-hydroxylase subunit alpha-2 [Vespula squamosa]|uniref:Prolyl 4-hydroxylase subunit alpha-2 n=1 Tax=Vespula squamosa TaxID=30214 RepID=A0ABD2C5P8_VESSQ